MTQQTKLKLESAFEVIAQKFNTTDWKVGIAYATGNQNVVSMVNKLTGLK
jgi:hypothetical protein